MKCLCILSGILFLAVTRADESTAKMVLSKMRKEVTLQCSADNVSWKKKFNTSMVEFSELELGENLVEKDGNLVIKKLKDEDLGVYACFDSDDTWIQEFEVSLGLRIKKPPASVSVDIGDTSGEKLRCAVMSKHDVMFRWYTRPEGSEETHELTPLCGVENDNCLKGPSSPSAEEVKEKEVTTSKPFLERVIITQGKEGDESWSVLEIDNAQVQDRAVYSCHAIVTSFQNDVEYNCETSTFCEEVFIILRVKDPLAALWPFIGIVIEVIVLCLVIFICERRKKDEDKEEVEDEGYTGNNVSSNNSLRQRK